MSSILTYAVFLLIPLAALTAFAVCLIRFLVGKSHGIADALLRPRKIAMIITAAIAGGLLLMAAMFIAIVFFTLIVAGM